MKRILIVAMAAICLSVNAQAWREEPKAVFGIALGERLGNDEIRDCGGVQNHEGEQKIAVCALNKPKFGEGDVSISGIPIDAFRGGLLSRSEGVVTGIALSADHARYKDVRAILVERYGKPSKVTKDTVQNKVGGNFSSEALVWAGRNVTLTLVERSGTVDRSVAVFVHNASAAASGNAANVKTKSDASKL